MPTLCRCFLSVFHGFCVRVCHLMIAPHSRVRLQLDEKHKRESFKAYIRWLDKGLTDGTTPARCRLLVACGSSSVTHALSTPTISFGTTGNMHLDHLQRMLSLLPLSIMRDLLASQERSHYRSILAVIAATQIIIINSYISTFTRYTKHSESRRRDATVIIV